MAISWDHSSLEMDLILVSDIYSMVRFFYQRIGGSWHCRVESQVVILNYLSFVGDHVEKNQTRMILDATSATQHQRRWTLVTRFDIIVDIIIGLVGFSLCNIKPKYQWKRFPIIRVIEGWLDDRSTSTGFYFSWFISAACFFFSVMWRDSDHGLFLFGSYLYQWSSQFSSVDQKDKLYKERSHTSYDLKLRISLVFSEKTIMELCDLVLWFGLKLPGSVNRQSIQDRLSDDWMNEIILFYNNLT